MNASLDTGALHVRGTPQHLQRLRQRERAVGQVARVGHVSVASPAVEITLAVVEAS